MREFHCGERIIRSVNIHFLVESHVISGHIDRFSEISVTQSIVEIETKSVFHKDHTRTGDRKHDQINDQRLMSISYDRQ